MNTYKLELLSIWRKLLLTVSAAVRAHVQASLWWSQAAHPHFDKFVPTFKTACWLNLSPNINAKVWMKYQENLVFVVLCFPEILAFNCTYNIGQNGSPDQPFLITFVNKKTEFMFRRWPFR